MTSAPMEDITHGIPIPFQKSIPKIDLSDEYAFLHVTSLRLFRTRLRKRESWSSPVIKVPGDHEESAVVQILESCCNTVLHSLICICLPEPSESLSVELDYGVTSFWFLTSSSIIQQSHIALNNRRTIQFNSQSVFSVQTQFSFRIALSLLCILCVSS